MHTRVQHQYVALWIDRPWSRSIGGEALSYSRHQYSFEPAYAAVLRIFEAQTVPPRASRAGAPFGRPPMRNVAHLVSALDSHTRIGIECEEKKVDQADVFDNELQEALLVLNSGCPWNGASDWRGNGNWYATAGSAQLQSVSAFGSRHPSVDPIHPKGKGGTEYDVVDFVATSPVHFNLNLFELDAAPPGLNSVNPVATKRS